ncbi:MAG: sodium-dependent bicarbonate transport family permease, partial [Actinomycetota bacterium]
MNADVLRNLTDPAVLFFFLGVAIGLVRSNLEVPAAIAKFLSLYLLMALGFKGGAALADSGLSGDGVKVIGAAVFLALIIPTGSFLVLRRRIDTFDAAAIAATYGSVSAVTFVTASQFVAARGDAAGGHMTVALVLMEAPAIIIAVLLATGVRSRATTNA